jgi:hypothetical protein
VRQGVYPADFADFIPAEDERAIEKIERRESPFGDGWPEWEPDPIWQTPVLLPEWDQEPPVLWDHRVWTYGDIARGT